MQPSGPYRPHCQMQDSMHGNLELPLAVELSNREPALSFRPTVLVAHSDLRSEVLAHQTPCSSPYLPTVMITPVTKKKNPALLLLLIATAATACPLHTSHPMTPKMDSIAGLRAAQGSWVYHQVTVEVGVELLLAGLRSRNRPPTRASLRNY